MKYTIYTRGHDVRKYKYIYMTTGGMLSSTGRLASLVNYEDRLSYILIHIYYFSLNGHR